MKLLEEKIRQDGNAVNEHILKVDSFINHQVDPALMQEMGKEIAEHFRGRGITKVATIESSGISPALMTALALEVPMVILGFVPDCGHIFYKRNKLRTDPLQKIHDCRGSCSSGGRFSGKRGSRYRRNPADTHVPCHYCRPRRFN